MRNLKILKILLIMEIMVQTVYALDPMYDYRYTLGPEILVPDAFHVGLGGWTRYNEDLAIATNVQLGLTDRFEIGMKYIGGTNGDWVITGSRSRSHLSSLIDIGAKYAVSQHLTLQADVPMSINSDMDWGGVLSLTQWDGYTKNVSFIIEGRLGFGGAAGHGRYVKPAVAFFPYFQLTDAFRLSVGTISSLSVGSDHFKDDFMVDILPRVEVGLLAFRIQGEISFNILVWDSEKYERYKRFALFIIADV